MAKSSGFKLIANNKKAYFDFFIDDKFECGIALAGTEVKSLRMGKCSIKESFIRIENADGIVVFNGAKYSSKTNFVFTRFLLRSVITRSRLSCAQRSVRVLLLRMGNP